MTPLIGFMDAAVGHIEMQEEIDRLRLDLIDARRQLLIFECERTQGDDHIARRCSAAFTQAYTMRRILCDEHVKETSNV